MKFWNWGPTTIGHYCMSVILKVKKSLHPNMEEEKRQDKVADRLEKIEEKMNGTEETNRLASERYSSRIVGRH